MKPLVAIFCIALLTLGLQSCGGGGGGGSTPAATSAAQGIASTAAVSVVTAK